MSMLLLADSPITLERLAEASSSNTHSARKYLYGERCLPEKARSELISEHGEAARTLIGELDRKRAAYEDSHPNITGGHKRLAISKPKPRSALTPQPRRVTRDAISPADPDWDGTKLPWTEWVAIYGRPAGSLPNGRIEGYFPTEPCFCE